MERAFREARMLTGNAGQWFIGYQPRNTAMQALDCWLTAEELKKRFRAVWA